MTPAAGFQSALGPAIAAYIDLKRALGRQFRNEAAVLQHLDCFLSARNAGDLTAEGFAAWALTLGRLTPTVRRQRMLVVRNLCLYLRRTDPLCFLPDTDGFPALAPPRRPFLFSRQQVLTLLRQAAKLRPTAGSPLRAEVYRLAVVLLYTAGLRRGELLRLAIGDYDPRQRTLLVRDSKFHKSRLIALSDSAAQEVERYLAARRSLPHAPDAPLLANCHGGRQGYSGSGLAYGLRSLFRAANIRTPSGDLPRGHDMRHTHATHVLLRWYRAGVDPQAKLPALATSMGHVSPVSTAYYLTLLDPVIESAADRFARHARPLLAPLPGASDDA